MQLHDRLSEDMANQLEVTLRQRFGGRMAAVRVTIQEQGVVLYGFAATFYTKQMAQHTAAQVTGLPVLANDIEVR